MTRAEFRRLLDADVDGALVFERILDRERTDRRLAAPHTNLGSGRGRFRIVLDRLAPLLADTDRLCDVGIYPGTAPRLIRSLPGGGTVSMTGLGLGISPAFTAAMSRLNVDLHEVELDLRVPPAGSRHILSCPPGDLGGPFDVCLCTEVIEHQMHPASLLLGLSRLTRPGGTVLLTTNSVSFAGDLTKLIRGRHNVESLERSHVVSDSDWRPHIRLYTAGELRELFERAGFTVLEARYIDNGNVYRGLKGAATAAFRALSGVVPHFRSHVLVVARRDREPGPELVAHLHHMAETYGLADAVSDGAGDVAAT